MRKRKLYLSELLRKTLNKDYYVRIITKTNNKYCYENVITCLQEINNSSIWNSLVIEWQIIKTWITTSIDIKIDID